MKLNLFERHLGVLLIIPAFALLMIISIYPLIYSIYMSTMEWNYLKAYIDPQFIGAGNFINLFQDPLFFNTVQVTALFVIMSVSIELVLGIGLGVLFYSESLKWKRLLRGLFLMPMMVTPVIIGFTFKAILNLKWGIVNILLSYIGIEGIKWHTSPITALPTMALMDIWEWTPFVVLVTIALLSSLPKEPFEAAAIDGASRFQIFTRMTLPMIKDGVMMIVLIRLLDALRDFDKIFILTRGGPQNTTDVVSIFGFRIAFFHGYVAYAAAASIILFIVIMILCALLFKLIQR